MQVRDFWSVPTVVGKRASWEPKQLLAKEPCCRLHWEERIQEDMDRTIPPTFLTLNKIY
jgi:hypothetical protein